MISTSTSITILILAFIVAAVLLCVAIEYEKNVLNDIKQQKVEINQQLLVWAGNELRLKKGYNSIFINGTKCTYDPFFNNTFFPYDPRDPKNPFHVI